MNYDGQLAIVTGTSRGIGPYIAKNLAGKGVIVVGVARSEDGLKQTMEEVQAEGGTFHPVPWDLGHISELEKLVEKITQIYGPIDILVNNAGVEQYNYFHKVSQEELISIVNINLMAAMELARLVLPQMLEQGRGHVVSIASLAGKKGVAYNSIYSAAKAGVVMWTDGLRQELEGTGVHASVICPGYISDTGMFHDGHVDPPALLGTSKPERVADAVLKALESGSSEIIVNSGPIRPLLAIAQVFPKFGDKVIKWFGVPELSRKRIDS